MNIFKTDKIIDRLDKMLDNAIDGKPTESSFDESKLSALETKLAKYLAISQTSRQKLEEEKAKINELVSDISHQTKTPIANILLYAELLEESKLSDKDSKCAHELAQQAEKLSFLIASLVKTSRLENGIIVLSPKPQPLQPLLNDVMEQCKSKAAQKGIALTGCDTQAEAFFDYKWTAEALSNIVDNAIKYTAVGGKIAVSATSYQLFCRIDICDKGIGIPEDELGKIFTRFYRSPSVSDIEGVGIGLYLAREIVSDGGGYIKVSSKVGQGSTFSVFLPMKS